MKLTSLPLIRSESKASYAALRCCSVLTVSSPRMYALVLREALCESVVKCKGRRM